MATSAMAIGMSAMLRLSFASYQSQFPQPNRRVPVASDDCEADALKILKSGVVVRRAAC